MRAVIRTPQKWKKPVLIALAGAGIGFGGQKLVTQSPIHFGVQGVAPVDAEGWECAPEGGLIGAPLVCRPRPEIIAPVNTETKTAQ